MADAIGQQMAAHGVAVDICRAKDVSDLRPYSGVVVGSAIHGGKWLPEAVSLVEGNHDTLSQVPTAYFLVCMMMTHPEKYMQYVEKWLEPARALVSPVAEGHFTGAILLNRYSFIEGLGLRVFLAGIKTPAGDHRDWDAIRAWTDSTLPLLTQ